MKELLISWKPSTTIPSGTSVVRRIYRWGSYIGILCKNEWNVEQRTPVQETPMIEECISVFRAAPPAMVDDAWEETYIDHGDYQSVEGSLLQIRITSKNYKKQIMIAIAVGCPIDGSILRMCETMVQPVELIPQMMEETPVSRLVPLVPRSVPQQSRVIPQIPLQGDRRQLQEGRRQGDRRQLQEGRRQDWVPDRSQLNGGAHRAPLAAAPVHQTLSLTPSGWLGTED